MNIYLGEHFDEFVRRQVATGRYANASEVVREALRNFEDKVKYEKLTQLVAEGMEEYQRGEFIEWTPDFMKQISKEADEAERLGLPIPDHVKP